MARDTQASDFTTGSTAAINTILAEEANRIGNDVHQRMMHTSPWIDLIKKSAFPDGMGYQLTTLIYDRTLPTSDPAENPSGSAGRTGASTTASAGRFSRRRLGRNMRPIWRLGSTPNTPNSPAAPPPPARGKGAGAPPGEERLP